MLDEVSEKGSGSYHHYSIFSVPIGIYKHSFRLDGYAGIQQRESYLPLNVVGNLVVGVLA